MVITIIPITTAITDITGAEASFTTVNGMNFMENLAEENSKEAEELALRSLASLHDPGVSPEVAVEVVHLTEAEAVNPTEAVKGMSDNDI